MKLNLSENYPQPIWSIGVGKSREVKAIFKAFKMTKPALTAENVTDMNAEFVADPFMIRHNQKFYMFFEVLGCYDQKGYIGLASSSCGLKWNYEKIVLDEPFHLSYPYVFLYQEDYYMLPECGESGYIKLYKASKFPEEWKLVSNLLEGTFSDPSLLLYNNMFWLFAEKQTSEGERNCNLHLYYSHKLETGWIEHPSSPIVVNNFSNARPAGRIVWSNNELLRFAQKDFPYYGESVSVIKIKKLDVDTYEEEALELVLKGTGVNGDWNKDGMHHLDFCQIAEDEWLVALDGHIFKNIGFFRHKYKRQIVKLLKLVWRFRKNSP